MRLSSCSETLDMLGLDVGGQSHCAACHVDGLQHVVELTILSDNSILELWVCCAVYDTIEGQSRQTWHQVES